MYLLYKTVCTIFKRGVISGNEINKIISNLYFIMPLDSGICLHYIQFNTTNIVMELRLKHC